MSNVLKVISGVIGAGVIGVIPVSYVIYDKNNPKGYSFLVKDGYTFNNPQFVEYDQIGQGCYKNLFKDSDDDMFSQDKVYGCAIMKMDKYEGNGKLNFNSEISIRKSDKGLVLNTRIVNTDKAYLIHIATELEKKNDKWEYRIDNYFGNKKVYVFAYEIKDNNQVNIKVPTEEWFNDTLNSSNYTESKEYKGIWISDDKGTDNWMLEKIETSVENEKLWGGANMYSSNQSIIASFFAGVWKIVAIPNQDIEKGFSNIEKDHTNPDTFVPPYTTWTRWLHEIKDIKGTWMDLEKICSLSDKRNPDEEEMNKLKMFCANKGFASNLLTD